MPIRVELTRTFLKATKKLPLVQQRKLAVILHELSENPYSPLLHTKPLTGSLTGLYSFRITRDWRVIFQFLDPELLKLTDVAHRKDIYR